MALLTRRVRRVALVALAEVGAAVAAAGAVDAQVFLTQEEALEAAFGADAVLERRTAYLTDAQAERVEALAGAEGLEQRVVTYYVASREGRPVGAAWFDVHRVRTLPEVLMVAVDPAGRVTRVEVLKFSEPPDYLAPDGWLEQFHGRELDDGLSLKGDIVNMTGATLTSRAVADAVRRVLALHRVVAPLSAP